MTSEEEIRCQHIRKLILANDPDNEYEVEISSASYGLLKAEFCNDDDDDSYPRLFYDWTRQIVTIVTVPTRLHEDTSRTILSHLCNRVESLMLREGIRLLSGQRLRISSSPTEVIKNGLSNYEMQPDGVIYFKTSAGEERKVVVEVGVSQTYDSLLRKARKWIFDTKCNIVLLLAFYEKQRYSAPLESISLTSRQMDDKVVQMNLRWSSPNFSGFGALEYEGHTWLDEISQAFIEVVRKDPDSNGTNAVVTNKYVLIEEGRDISSGVPETVGDLRLAELMPPESLGDGDAAGVVIDFFHSSDFMSIVRDAVISTAVNRFKKAVKIIV
ncbi:uncharacterized protein V1513DRAFT_375388 [Lipomyces chichibuensis]|uniref:uncharacterized protein n=1 Tax=Lipomyces chichibuensis TaxID=1546026 RepID=UPI003343C701